MIIGVDAYQFYGLIGLAVLMIIAFIGLYQAISKNAPDAMTHWKAKRKNQPICRVHYRGRKAVDYVATIEKLEKDMGSPYWSVPDVGLKFKPRSEDIETIEGSIPCANYYTNLTEAMSIAQIVAFSQLKDWFAKMKMPIDSIEGIALYTAQEYIKTGDKMKALANAKIESKETKVYLLKYLNLIDIHRKELEKMKIETGIFTFQTAMKAMDEINAMTSSHVEHLQKVVRAAALRQAEDANAKKRELIYMAIVGFILCIGAAAFLIATK